MLIHNSFMSFFCPSPFFIIFSLTPASQKKSYNTMHQTKSVFLIFQMFNFYPKKSPLLNFGGYMLSVIYLVDHSLPLAGPHKEVKQSVRYPSQECHQHCDTAKLLLRFSCLEKCSYCFPKMLTQLTLPLTVDKGSFSPHPYMH